MLARYVRLGLIVVSVERMRSQNPYARRKQALRVIEYLAVPVVRPGISNRGHKSEGGTNIKEVRNVSEKLTETW